MEVKEFEKLTNSIKEKLGKENVSKIADDFGKLITDNGLMNKSLENKDKEIKKLKEDKEILQETNMNLLQQIPMGEETTIINDKNNPKDNKPKIIDFRAGFDENGNFKN